VALRIVGALSALGFGALLVVLGNFSATFKQTPPVWDAQAVSLVVAGVVVALAVLAWAVWPGRLSVVVAVGAVAGTLLLRG
jgi:hypothetical protein